jgi:hypothetical protein
MIGKMTRMAVVGAIALTVAGAAPAMARGTDVVRRGDCSGTSEWKLKLSPDDGRIEVEFEVDSNVVGQTWSVRILENGDRIFRGTRETQAPSGSFTVHRLAADTAGRDSFSARATNAATGETCVGTASI